MTLDIVRNLQVNAGFKVVVVVVVGVTVPLLDMSYALKYVLTMLILAKSQITEITNCNRKCNLIEILQYLLLLIFASQFLLGIG